MERISMIFKAKQFKTLKQDFSTLYNNIQHLPKLIGDFLHKLNKIFNKTINHITHDNVPSTNNKKKKDISASHYHDTSKKI